MVAIYEKTFEEQVKKSKKTKKLVIIVGIILIIIGIPLLPLTLGILVLIGVLCLIFGLSIPTGNTLKAHMEYTAKYQRDKEELRQAQLDAIRKGKVKVEIKGKMSKLK